MPEANGTLWRDIFYSSFDDLRLHVRHYPGKSANDARAVVCLPGLTRNGRDFHYLASYLAMHSQRPREVYCLDYRGRGESEFDTHWQNYVPLVELTDTLDFMALEGLHNAAVIGTSRGGLIAMMMAAVRPTALGAVVLNDVGPVLETRGLARIMGFAGRMPVPKTWDDAGTLLREMNERTFPGISDAEWQSVAHDLFNEKKGRPAQGYDRKLSRAFGSIDLSKPVPDLWPQFVALSRFPTLVLRGANSDLLSAETLKAMTERHPNLRSITVPEQGHAPLLREPETVEAIGMFLAAND